MPTAGLMSRWVRARALAGVLALVGLGGAAASCGPRPEPPASTAREALAPRPRVEWGGCADVRLRGDAPVCAVDPARALRLWIEGTPAEPFAVSVDGQVVPAERYALDGERGHGMRVVVPPGATMLALRHPGATSERAQWSLLLEGTTPEPAPSPAQKQALVQFQRALAAGDAPAARRAAHEAHALALADGRLMYAVDVGLALAHAMIAERVDPEQVAQWLHHVEDAAARYPKGRGDLAYYRGLHLWYAGATGDAAEAFRDAARHAWRLHDETLAAEALPMYAETLAQLGYFDDARRWARVGLERARASREACDVGSVLRTVGWINLWLRRRGRDSDDPRGFLEEALAVFGDAGPCPRPDKLGGARLSLALLALDDGRLDAAAAQLGQIDRERLTADERLHVDDLALQLALAGPAGPKPRREAYRRLESSVATLDTAEARWRLHARRGRLLELDGDVAGAIEAYRSAERELDAIVRLQAVGLGRGELAERYHESTEALVSLHVDRGDVEAAWCVVREEQARRRAAALAAAVLSPRARADVDAMRQRYREEKLAAERLEAEAHALPRDEASRARAAAAAAHERASTLAHALVKTLARHAPHPRCTELSPPGPDELLLGLYPRAHDWLVLARDAAGTAVHVVTAPLPAADDREALARALLGPLGARLDAAGRVRVLAHRQAQHVDVHALPWGGEPLGARMPVSYGVELPVRPEPAAVGRRALLVADPTHTLEGAEAEVDGVAERLVAAGWSTDVIGPTDALAPGGVVLAGYDLFHYAGHAETSERLAGGGWPPYPGGDAGWAGFLELGRAGQLTVHDVTTLRAVPRAVVLAGCRTGAVELDSGQTSLALAFLVAGSEQVMASADAVVDARGPRLARALYDALVRAPGVDLAAALQSVQRELWHAGHEPAGYRTWVR
jgi:tetratricopeptide (TPR) repeat protein